MSDGPTGQRQRDAGREIQTNQHTDVGKANAELAFKQRRNRGDALELDPHGEANREQNGKDAPAIAHIIPRKITMQPEAARRGCQSLLELDGVKIGIAADFK